MRQSKWLAALLVLAVAGCAGEDDSDSVVLEGVEDSIAMEPAHIPEAGMDQPPGGMGQTAQLEPLQGSGVGGEVTIADRGGELEVLVRLTGAPADTEHPGHIHAGTCAQPGSVVQPLQPIATDSLGTGTMTTNVSLPASTVMNGEHIVVYHGTGGRPITCAAIPRSGETGVVIGS